MTLRPDHILILVAAIVCLVFSVAMGSYAYYTNEGFGFPLDDPWIHLQFAQNLADYGSFSYYKDEMVTSGSTAPLYTVLLAVGLLITDHEMVLSYVLGVLFFLAGVVVFFKILGNLFPDKRFLVFGGTLLFALEPRLHWIALSGMETTLFILLLLTTMYFYNNRRSIPLGASAGLLLWTRPEAVILFGILFVDLLYRTWWENNTPGSVFSSWPWRALAILTGFAVAYAAFNYILSGSLLPNTYAAKLKYYSTGSGNFPLEVFKYLTGGHMVGVSLLAGIGLVMTIARAFRRQHTPGLVPLLFLLAMFVAYWINLPYLYQNGRYLMPVLPFIVILGCLGIDWFMKNGTSLIGLSPGENSRRIIAGVILAIMVMHFAYGSWQERVLYQDYCKYINDRQVRVAHWMRENLPEDAVIATHDVGAIAYYSERRIVDMVGLISPEMIERIGDLNKLRDFLISRGVTHLALLRNWFEVVNVNPIFQTNEASPEIMEVFAFDPQKVHFTSGRVAWLTSNGWAALSRGDVRQGGPMVDRAVQLDPGSSRARHHLGWALMMAGQLDRAEEEFRLAIELHPEYWQAHYALAQIPLKRNDPRESLNRLEKLLKNNPKMLAVYQAMAQIHGQMGDTTKARAALEAFRNKMNEVGR